MPIAKISKIAKAMVCVPVNSLTHDVDW